MAWRSHGDSQPSSRPEGGPGTQILLSRMSRLLSGKSLSSKLKRTGELTESIVELVRAEEGGDDPGGDGGQRGDGDPEQRGQGEQRGVAGAGQRDQQREHDACSSSVVPGALQLLRRCTLGREEAPKHFFRRTAITSPHCQEFMV